MADVPSVALVLERTIPTERPPLVGEVSVNFWDGGCRVVSATGVWVGNRLLVTSARHQHQTKKGTTSDTYDQAKETDSF
jgi:hypothetical protein